MMHYLTIICIIILLVEVLSQGGGGGNSKSSNSYSGSYSNSRSGSYSNSGSGSYSNNYVSGYRSNYVSGYHTGYGSSSGDDCDSEDCGGNTVFGIIGAVIVFIIICIAVGCNRNKRTQETEHRTEHNETVLNIRDRETNLITPINTPNTLETEDSTKQNDTVLNIEETETNLTTPIDIPNIFKSGHWLSRYNQYAAWHGPYEQDIYFTIEKNTLIGYGKDDIGHFILNGSISTDLLTINMVKSYIRGTGNPEENLGHAVKINLKWNKQNNLFQGKWSVHTSKYEGEGLYELFKK